MVEGRILREQYEASREVCEAVIAKAQGMPIPSGMFLSDEDKKNYHRHRLIVAAYNLEHAGEKTKPQGARQ